MTPTPNFARASCVLDETTGQILCRSGAPLEGLLNMEQIYDTTRPKTTFFFGDDQQQQQQGQQQTDIEVIQGCESDEEWDAYLNARFGSTYARRSAEPLPEADADAEAEVDGLVKRKEQLVARKKKPGTGSSGTGSSAAGRTVVGALGVWVALAWVVGVVL